MRRVLFVDDEINVLDGLRRMMRPLRHEWQMEFAPGGCEALEILNKGPFDVVVTDMRMPNMDGAALLAHVRDRYPHVVRIVLSGQADREAMIRSVAVTHQHLSKPCDPDLLKSTVTRACAIKDLLANDALRRVVSRLKAIPSLPSLYTEVMNELQTADPSTQKVGEIIAKDPGMTGKILQMVNSSFFGVRRHVASPAQAAVLLGAEAIKALVLSVQIFTQFDQLTLRQLSIDAVWTHSNLTGALARRIAQAEHADQKTADHSFLAGLLHDAGKLVLAAHYSERYSEAVTLADREKLVLQQAEHNILGTSHAEVGAYLLGLWGLPDPVVEAVAWHHAPMDCPASTFCPLTAVHVANSLMHECQGGPDARLTHQMSIEYLDRIGLADHMESWRSLAQEQSGESRT
jgi:HD-like signal output (HDOD) protein